MKTNKDYMASLSAEDFYAMWDWLTHAYGKKFTDSRIAIIEWLKSPYIKIE